jgi:hypothetical protein
MIIRFLLETKRSGIAPDVRPNQLRPCVIRPHDGQLSPVNARTCLFSSTVIEGGAAL